MNPSNKEMQLHKNCQLYAYVLTSQGKEVPQEIQDCIDDYEYVINCSEDLYKEIKGLDTDTFEIIVNNKELLESRELSYWWEMYKEYNRIQRELSSGAR
ncbi:hypothetical protein [Sulfurimonas sp.]|jgi:hypothetical protein|uniref:hypothetical protein n=1 Tax=Sulfurimonas sp. TaxID=2022749 RepID=UPI0025D728ED|nr:hypothetical protein [Sulfurimonas sp.]MBT5934800.1 hypothetical protein [Sulfurimonas sp.]